VRNTNKYVQITEDSLEEGIALSVVTEAIVSVTEKSSDDTSKEVFWQFVKDHDSR